MSLIIQMLTRPTSATNCTTITNVSEYNSILSVGTGFRLSSDLNISWIMLSVKFWCECGASIGVMCRKYVFDCHVRKSMPVSSFRLFIDRDASRIAIASSIRSRISSFPCGGGCEIVVGALMLGGAYRSVHQWLTFGFSS